MAKSSPSHVPSSRDSLRAAVGALVPLKRESVNLTGADGQPSGLVVEIRELTTGERYDLQQASLESFTGPDGEPRFRQRNDVLFPSLIARAAHDPESGERLWTDVADVAALPQAITAQLTPVALRVCGIGGEMPVASDATEGNGSAPSAPTSTSPTN